MMICSTPRSVHPEEAQGRKIIELRALLAEKFPVAATPPERSRVPTGIEVFDRCLDGGLPKAALTEIICPNQSMGSGTIIQALIDSAHATGKYLALVDAGDSFDADKLTNEQLAAVLWVRCSGPEQAIKATDLICRDNNLPLVVLDESNGSVALVFTPTSVVSSAASTLRLTRRFGLSALDLLRDQLTARLQMETVRARAFAPPHRSSPSLALAVG